MKIKDIFNCRPFRDRLLFMTKVGSTNWAPKRNETSRIFSSCPNFKKIKEI